MYWGDQPFTGGPAYAGAVILFLFVLGMFIVKSPVKWWLLAVTLLFIMFTWGKNFAVFNYLIFDFLPGYNKFRAVTMVIAVVQIYLCVLAVMAVREIIQENLLGKALKKPLAISAGLTAGLALLLGLFAGAFFDFAGGAEARAQYPALAHRSPARRPQIFVSARCFPGSFLYTATVPCSGLMYKIKLKASILYAGLLVLVFIDMFTVSKRYLNNDDFVVNAAHRSKYKLQKPTY